VKSFRERDKLVKGMSWQAFTIEILIIGKKGETSEDHKGNHGRGKWQVLVEMRLTIKKRKQNRRRGKGENSIVQIKKKQAKRGAKGSQKRFAGHYSIKAGVPREKKCGE